jgi:transposase-like protein
MVDAKRKTAEESFEGNSSVAQLGQKYAVNANQIFLWRGGIAKDGGKTTPSKNAVQRLL